MSILLETDMAVILDIPVTFPVYHGRRLVAGPIRTDQTLCLPAAGAPHCLHLARARPE